MLDCPELSAIYSRLPNLAYTDAISSSKGRIMRRDEVRRGAVSLRVSLDASEALGAVSGSPRVHYEALLGAG